jgi:hypothetical protein
MERWTLTTGSLNVAPGNTPLDPWRVPCPFLPPPRFGKGNALERNQSNYILLSIVQDRRCLHPTNKDPFAGTLNLGVAST